MFQLKSKLQRLVKNEVIRHLNKTTIIMEYLRASVRRRRLRRIH